MRGKTQQAAVRMRLSLHHFWIPNKSCILSARSAEQRRIRTYFFSIFATIIPQHTTTTMQRKASMPVIVAASREKPLKKLAKSPPKTMQTIAVQMPIRTDLGMVFMQKPPIIRCAKVNYSIAALVAARRGKGRRECAFCI